ncbi:MAG: hypothetical protein J6031_03470 [Bacteroidales bacterium]|nr:hypothetical protein [Bacteroidales bacterium]
MKNTRILLLTAIIAGSLVGCSKTTYYQVYQSNPVSTSQCEMKDGKLYHDAGNCVVRYNFFDENGDAGFWFTNNSDSVVYVNLAETFFILNGNANDYYQARGWTTTKSSTITISKQERKNKKKATSESTEGTSTSEMKASQVSERDVVMIPPHSTKYFSEFRITTREMELCGIRDTPKKGKPVGLSFTEENSLLTFGNFVTYTVGSKGKKKHIADNFFVSEIINVNGGAMFETVRAINACGKETGERVERIRYSTPDRFYVIYKR